MTDIKYADLVMKWLQDLGYTHCFFVAGGNSMHLLDGARRTMNCVPFVHEVSAGIAAEYFNEVQVEQRAFVLVTAGPGLTNLLTAMAGAYLESRELLVLGGQVKSTDLASPRLRQRGIQEVDGVSLASPVSVVAERLEIPMERIEFDRLVRAGSFGRPGPVFLEICLDVQGAMVDPSALDSGGSIETPREVEARPADLVAIAELVRSSVRPVMLLGGGVDRGSMNEVLSTLSNCQLPVMTTWNAADRIPADHPLYMGRPNTWGQRSSNIILQQADLLLAFGTRLGLQQTGFNWQEFLPLGRVVQVDIDPEELSKGHPHVDVPVCADATSTLLSLLAETGPIHRPEWMSFARSVRRLLPLSDPENSCGDDYIDPFEFAGRLSSLCGSDDQVIPCSSGGAFTAMMQAFEQKHGQVIVTDKGLASMGYGLAGAVGASLASPERRTVLVEGDGGFAQNLQELATVANRGLNLKIFIFANKGYASIRMTQRNYFDGAYLGCDDETGLGFPDWELLATAFHLPSMSLGRGFATDPEFLAQFKAAGPMLFVVPVDPEQTYFPKISSRVMPDGSMASAPLHLMSPDLSPDLTSVTMPFFPSAD